MSPVISYRRTAAAAAIVAALGAGSGILAGSSQADAGRPEPSVPVVPAPQLPSGPDDLVWEGPYADFVWLPGMPPSQNPFGPPGQVMKMPTLPLPDGASMPNPFYGTAPGQWGGLHLKPTDITVTLPGGNTTTLTWDGTQDDWGYLVNGSFVRFPLVFPPPSQI